ncbi:MAG: YbdK family carboxylate-amine ligase [Epsilonproteobacteria bacterium]|nr:YbdK family carboxylate-amine ligase [Campylobacterota bacterium]
MYFEPWENAKAYSIGAELEARFQDKDSFELKDYSTKILSKIDEKYKKRIHQEFLECMVEFVTPVCETPKEAIKELKNDISYLLSLSDDFVLTTSGSYSLKVDPLKHIDDPRYDAFAKEYGILLSRFHICGFHIHIGMPSSDEALQAYNTTLEYLPIFLALSANSPFFNGEFTGLLSYRAKLFEQLPRAGLSSYFDSYEDMRNLYLTMHKAGTLQSHKDIWWDVRISPVFKTLEIRICDASNDFERLELLIYLFQALSLYAQKKPLEKIPHQILLQNRWNAAKHGLDGLFQTNNKICTVREHFLDLLETMENEGIFSQLNTTDSIPRLKELASKDELARKEIKEYQKNSDLLKVEKMGEVKI